MSNCNLNDCTHLRIRIILNWKTYHSIIKNGKRLLLMETKILVLNLGSTSSKIAINFDNQCVFYENLKHDMALTSLPLSEQEGKRLEEIHARIRTEGYDLHHFDGIACRGGLVKPIEGGVYHVTKEMVADLSSFKYGSHASNLSAMTGYTLGNMYGVPVYTLDPPVTDEFIPISRVTGIKGVARKSVYHALNQKAVARMYAKSVNRPYDEINVIVAHMGGGTTVGAHLKGKVVDVNDGLLGEGPMSPERAGSVPNDALYQYGFERQMSPKDFNHFLSRKTGFISLCGSNDVESICREMDQNAEYKLAVDSCIYQVSKAIGERSISLKGQVDQIILTGGLAYNTYITDEIKRYVDWIAPVTIYAGEKEMDALATRVYDLFIDHEEAKDYR